VVVREKRARSGLEGVVTFWRGAATVNLTVAERWASGKEVVVVVVRSRQS